MARSGKGGLRAGPGTVGLALVAGRRTLAAGRRALVACTAAVLAAAGGVAAGGAGPLDAAHAARGSGAAGALGAAHAARTLTVTDAARLRLARANGNTLYERGRATGTLPGTVEVSLTLRGRAANSSFAIRTSRGTISGHGQGTLKTGKGGYASFGGWLVVTRGTGRFRGASGKGGLYGSIYRVTDAMSVQVTGTLRY
jgi:hypothetical protein